MSLELRLERESIPAGLNAGLCIRLPKERSLLEVPADFEAPEYLRFLIF
jgi:hypothetical protein